MTTTVHWRTPNLTVIDSRGLPIRQIEYLRKVIDGPLETLITRQRHDAAGRLLEQSDPRLFGIVPNLSTTYRLSGEPLKVCSVDAGWRLSLAGLAGEELQRWDQRGSHWRTTYDPQLRPLAIEENGQPNVETFMYADASGDPGCNLRGQMIKQTDSSGGLELSSFSLQGQSLRETRKIADKVFVGSRTWSPLGAMLTQTDAGNHQQQLRYDIAGQLKKTQLRIKPEDAWLPILEDAQYNAAGQIIEQRAGNKVVSRWIYDAVDGRLKHLKAGVPETALRQNLEYVHDRVGNVLRIDDHTFQTRFFANQHMDGHREFTYDSLYRLISATGHDAPPTSDLPGRPLPSDPNNHLNYHQTYEYDLGGNLNKLIHGRAVGGYTQEMLIDPSSNRGVRGKEGDPVPDFPALFDRHGNLRALHSGIDLQWSSRDQLASVTLVKREDGPDDEETYRYSQGVRVYKCHQWHTPSTSHFHEVMYWPGLEIRKRDNGEELHVITLPSGFGSVRCLHWVSAKPDGIDADQLRYSLDDPLGSSLMELDQHASLISHEGYYPFGGTAWLTADSALEVSYKTIRYSGKEMDVSGLYYYGLRYYAPWLWRWVNPDPLGDVDGLNLYAFVGNNPLLYVDGFGASKEKWEIHNYALFISSLVSNVMPTLKRIENIAGKSGIAKSLLKNTLGEGLSGTTAFFGGFYGSEAIGGLLPGVDINLDPYAVGFIGGNAGGDLADESEVTIRAPFKLVRPLIPQTSTMTIAEIDRQAGLDVSSDNGSVLDQGILAFFGRFVGSVVPGVSALIALGSRVQEAEDIKNGLTPVKIDKIDKMLVDWKTTTEQRWARAKINFKKLGTDVIYPADILPNVTYMTPKSTLQPISLAGLENQTKVTLAKIERSQERMRLYREAGTTDNRFLERQRRKAA
ncbi:RHS repeat domain-containing protein [Pseudomonas sp. LS2P72]